MELAAEAHVAVPEPESVITPEAAADRAAPERGPGSATAAQGEAGQEPPPQGEEESTSAVQEDLRQKKSVCKLRNLYSTVQIVGNAKIILIIINFLLALEKLQRSPLFQFTYGVNAWKHWVVQKNAELEKLRAQGKYMKTFETDILKLR